MTAIGLDPSLTGLGICCIGDDGTLTETVLPKSPACGPTIGARIRRYRAHANNAAEWLLANVNPGPLLIEGYSYGSKGRSILDLAEFGCYLRVKLLSSGFTPVEVSPTTLKKFATGKGKGDKVVIAAALAYRYKREFPGGDNQADAFGLAKLCEYAMGMAEPETSVQNEVVVDVRKAMEAERKNKPW